MEENGNQGSLWNVYCLLLWSRNFIKTPHSDERKYHFQWEIEFGEIKILLTVTELANGTV